MPPLGKSLLRRNFRRKSSSTSSPVTSTAVSSSLLTRLVFLHEWWLIKSDRGTRLGVGGFVLQENQERSFISAPIVKRDDAVTLTAVDGITIVVHGLLNRSRTLENGFSSKVCDHFIFGFPYDWEEFAAVSFDEPENPTVGDHESGALKSIFDDMLKQNDDAALASQVNKETSPRITTIVSTPDFSVSTHESSAMHKDERSDKKSRSSSDVASVKRNGPVTRSRLRLQNR